MPDLRKMTVQSLRELARKVLGPGHTRLKTKSELVNALEEAGSPSAAEAPDAPTEASARKAAPSPARSSRGAAEKPSPGKRVRAAAAKAVEATGKAVKAAKAAAGAAGKAGGARSAAAKAEAKPPGAKARAVKAAAAAVGAAAGAKVARPRKAGAVATAAAKVAGAAVGAALGAAGAAASARAGAKAARAKATSRAAKAAAAKEKIGTDPEGYFVARVRGEDAVREAPHPLVETGEVEEGSNGAGHEEGLGELPWGYGDDAFVALPRDPRTLFLYWDWAEETVSRGMHGLDGPRTQLWIYARAGAAWERVRTLEFALESRGYYVHDLEPGRAYRAEIRVVDRRGEERVLARASNEVTLPPVGPSQIVDDRFIRLPWDLPLGALLGPGHPGGAFPDDVRATLARLSDWSRFAGRSVWGGSAGGMGGRPFSPASAPSSPSSAFGPSSPSSGYGPRGDGSSGGGEQ